MIMNIIGLILIILNLAEYSFLMGPLSQHTLYVSDYCPRMKHCKEGTHVMCTYYDHDRPIGPRCMNYTKTTITPAIVEYVLKLANNLRSRVAMGLEIGSKNLPLPRAYGMMRLGWDSELATLAQVLANQCLDLTNDLCRATDRFQNPSQILFRLYYPEESLSHHGLLHAFNVAFDYWHSFNTNIIEDNINHFQVPKHLGRMVSQAGSYLRILRGKATHIGCGTSAYRVYNKRMLPTGEWSSKFLNTVLIVCNISDDPQESQPVYTTDPPIPGTGFSEICGCPKGYTESEGCLCEQDNLKGITIHRLEQLKEEGRTEEVKTSFKQTCDDPSGNCEPKAADPKIFEVKRTPNREFEMENDFELQFHHSNNRFDNTTFFPSENSVENTNGLDEKYKEVSRSFKSNFKNEKSNSPHSSRSSTISDENKLNEFDTDINSAKERHSRHNNDFEDKMNVNDLYKDNDNTFLSLLDVMEQAVQDIDLDGDEKEIFDIKMRKIYDTVISTKNQANKSAKLLITTTQETETETEFQELKDHRNHKSDNVFGDNREDNEPAIWAKDARKFNKNTVVSMGNEISNYDYINRKESKTFETPHINKYDIDNRLIDIVSKKRFARLDNKYDFNSANNIADDQYADFDEYTLTPSPRHQETLLKFYENNLNKLEENRKHFTNGQDDYLKLSYKTMNAERNHHKNIGNENKRQIFDINNGFKTVDRRTFSYPKYQRRTHNSPTYRRVFETEHERPMFPMRNNQDIGSRTDKNVDRYFISDRATL